MAGEKEYIIKIQGIGVCVWCCRPLLVVFPNVPGHGLLAGFGAGA